MIPSALAVLGLGVCAVAAFAAGFAVAMRWVAERCERVLTEEPSSLERTKGRLDVVAAILFKETPR